MAFLVKFWSFLFPSMRTPLDIYEDSSQKTWALDRQIAEGILATAKTHPAKHTTCTFCPKFTLTPPKFSRETRHPAFGAIPPGPQRIEKSTIRFKLPSLHLYIISGSTRQSWKRCAFLIRCGSHAMLPSTPVSPAMSGMIEQMFFLIKVCLTQCCLYPVLSILLPQME